MKKLQIASSLVLSSVVAVGLIAAPVFASQGTSGNAGQTKVDIYDNTDNGWNVATNDPVTGGPDASIGFVNFRPTVPGDLTNVKVVAALKNGAPNCTYNIQLVTSGNNTSGGLAPDGFHTGSINVIGNLTTNGSGKGNSGELTVDTTTLVGAAVSGSITYAHVDIEAVGSCTEADGTNVANNEYGASAVAVVDRIQWLQP